MVETKNGCVLVKTEYFENCLNKKQELTADMKRIIKGFDKVVEIYDRDLTKSKFLI